MSKCRQLCEVWYRIRKGRWCLHCTQVTLDEHRPDVIVDTFTPWLMANGGANKFRVCHRCRRFEWV